jgi:predicted RNase H-like nuclease (RuvC/YqgF family)
MSIELMNTISEYEMNILRLEEEVTKLKNLNNTLSRQNEELEKKFAQLFAVYLELRSK